MRPIGRVRAILPLLACVALAACGGKDEAPAGTARPAASLAVQVVPAREREIQRAVIASGPVAAWEEMQLGVEVSGLRVTALHADVGQQVKRGQVLLQIDTRTLESDLRQAEAAAAEAAAGVQLAQTNLARGQALAKDKLISAAALDELRAQLVQAQARAATTRAQRDGVALRRDFATLRAPDDGIISARMVQPGQVVMAGAELLRMIRDGRLEWRPDLPEAELARIAVGQAVELRDGTGAAIAGRVRAVSPGVDTRTRTGTVYVDLPEPGALKAGAFVEGRLVTSASKALLVPAAAVVVRDGYSYVFTVDDGNVVHRVRVRTGASDAGEIEILEGLAAGTKVVATGAGFLGEGDVVRVVDAAAPAPEAPR